LIKYTVQSKFTQIIINSSIVSKKNKIFGNLFVQLVYARFEVLTALLLKIKVFWDVTLSYGLHLRCQVLQDECLSLSRAQKSYSCPEETQDSPFEG
jgi:hypothetical protein